ncbi:MAG: DUF424 family protein [Nanoarchaeota archaeon]|nr:DUF424 family protein [Nanoarchaeota archaeon]
MFVNIIESYRRVIAIADEGLIGKQFFEGKKQLDVKENFYKGENEAPLSKEEVIKIIKIHSKEDSTFNIVGEKSVACAIEAGAITENEVLKIDGIPYTLILL